MPHDTEENSLTRLQHARDEQLRKILMNTGKNKLEKDTSKRTQHASTKPMQKNGTVGLKRATDKVSSDEDDEGRASAFRSKRNKTARNSSGPLDYSKNGRLATKPSGKEGLVSTTLDVEKDGGSDDDEIFDKELPAAQRKHDDQNKSHRFPNQPAASYLDEVLRQSAEKRQRKKKKKDKRQRQSP
ncbi:MAG: hypothetical protein M1822_001097 [Bathelium mastoideum]|nr:MAG: hypothetical protein M1822_001097 [Bathelium mastoideum]